MTIVATIETNAKHAHGEKFLVMETIFGPGLALFAATVLYDLNCPTVPVKEPKPILPDDGVTAFSKGVLNVCVNKDWVTVVLPNWSVPVAQTKVGLSDVFVLVVEVVVSAPIT